MTKQPKLRGVELVDAVMDWREAQGETLVGMDAARLERETLGDRPLTPALRRWLEWDEKMFLLGPARSLEALIAHEYGDPFVEWFSALTEVLTEPCVVFDGWGADSRRFLYLGTPDAHGELPVFTLDTDDGPYACINGPVDVWLAQHAGLLDGEDHYGKVPAAYEEDRLALAETNFGGNVAFAYGGFGKTLDPFE